MNRGNKKTHKDVSTNVTTDFFGEEDIMDKEIGKERDDKKENKINLNEEVEVDDEGEKTEIATQITLPAEGGWGWIVVAASFCNLFILDGVFGTFGSLITDISRDFKNPLSVVAAANSLQNCTYYIMSPIASGVANRFGFRVCVMTGSIICALSLLFTYFAISYYQLIILYGIFSGLGASMIHLASIVVVGFYFEKMRSLAIGIATVGSSFGVMIFFPMNKALVDLTDWRATTLFHSGLFGLTFYLGMTYRPLLTLTMVETCGTVDNPTRTVTTLPNLKSTQRRTKSKTGVASASPSERLFQAVSNVNFPTTEKVLNESAASCAVQSSPAASTSTTMARDPNKSRLTITTNTTGAISQHQLIKVKSILKTSHGNKSYKDITFLDKQEREAEIKKLEGKKLKQEMKEQEQESEKLEQEKKKQEQEAGKHEQVTEKQEQVTEKQEPVKEKQEKKKKRKFLQFCTYDKHPDAARPMYRDDVFYEGELDDLPAYQKSVLQINPEERTGLEYQMAVTRAISAHDLEEKRGFCTTAVRRVLASMLDPTLLRTPSFLLFCFSSTMYTMGSSIPYIFVADKNETAGVDKIYCSFFVSVIGFSNACGRIAFGAIGSKFNPFLLLGCANLVAGISTGLSNLSVNLFYQFGYCGLYGFCMSAVMLRSVCLTHLYGLEKLTNSIGMVLIFAGIGYLFGSPIAGLLKESFGYSVAFYVSGLFVVVGGIFMLLVLKDTGNTNN